MSRRSHASSAPARPMPLGNAAAAAPRRLAGLALAALLGACGGAPPPAPPPEPTPQPAAPAPAATPAPAPAPRPAPAADATTLLEAGRQAVEQGDLSTAEARFADAARAAPDQPEAHYNLGVLAEWQGRVDAARGHYEDALRARPAFGPAVLAIGHLLMRRGDVEGALRLARDQLARAPKSADLRNAYNRLRLTAGRDAAQVEADSKDILRVDEKNVDAMINLAAASHANGKYELAIAILENAKALDPDDPEIHARQAMAHAALGEQLKARFVLEEATALPGGATAEIYNNLGLIYHEAGDYIGAELQFRKALARWPDMLGARINLGNALKGQQRYADADAVLRAALADHPRSPEVAYNLGILYLDGALPDLDPITRLERALAFFESYKQTSGARERDDPVDAYIGEARKRIEVERKKAEMGRRAPKDEPKAPDPAPEAEVPSGGEEK